MIDLMFVEWGAKLSVPLRDRSRDAPFYANLCEMEQATEHRTIDSMPAHARIWIYKSAIAFAPAQRARIMGLGAAFTASWAAHGAALDACVDVLHDHFLVIAVDEQQALASGCSIDKSVRFVVDLERELGLNLTDRMVILYEHEGAIATCRAQEVEARLKSGTMTADTIVFNDMLATVGDLRSAFRAPLRATWLARYL